MVSEQIATYERREGFQAFKPNVDPDKLNPYKPEFNNSVNHDDWIAGWIDAEYECKLEQKAKEKSKNEYMKDRFKRDNYIILQPCNACVGKTFHPTCNRCSNCIYGEKKNKYFTDNEIIFP